MRKVVIHRAGGYERLKLETHPDPTPGPGEVLVATEAIGVNFAEVIIRMGLYASAKELVGWPITPGFEFAGRVASVGEGVTDLAAGDEVMGVTRFGGYASHVVVPRRQLFQRPAGFTAEQAAGFPTVFLTAYFALFELAHPRPGSTLLVHSAAGGVGGALLQLGSIAKTRTIGVVGASHKVVAARELGAAEVIDKSSEPLWPAVRRLAPDGCDVVLDGNGATTLRQSYRHLAPGGKLVSYGFHSMFPRRGGRPRWLRMGLDYLRIPRFHPLQLTNDNKSVMACNLSYLFHLEQPLVEGMGQLLGWVKDGRIRPPQTTSFPLDEVAQAHQALESAQTVGKLILVP